MLRNKRKISLFLSLVMVLGIVFGILPEQAFADDTVSLKILHTNDIHGRFEYSDGREASIGFAKLKTKIDEVRAANSNVLLLDGGDTTHGTVDINLTEGKAMIDFMNTVKYDAMVSGNHDFNYGYERLLELRNLADFPVLAANVKKEDGSMDFESYKIQEMNGIKVGMFGLATEETKYKSSPTNTEGIDFTSYIEASRKAVAYFKDKNVDLIVAITHIGIDEETDVTTKDIAKEVDGIDVIIDGHSHTELPEGLVVNNTLIAQTGSYLKNLGMVDIEFKGGKVVSKKASLFSSVEAADIIEDPDMKAEIDAMLSSNEEVKKQVIGKSTVDLDGEREIVRKEESTLGNVITDAMLKSSGADVALTNGGGIRASIEKGDITLGAVMNAFPFTNFLRTIEVTGAEILQALEHGVDSFPGTAGKFPHVAGMKYVFDPYKPAGERVVDVKIAGKKLVEDQKYKLVTNDFVAIGGDGYEMFKGKKIIAEGALLSDVLVEYFNSEGTISPSIEGRITTLDGPVERLDGESRVETAVKISEDAFTDGSAADVVLVGYNGEADALSGSLLAANKKAPVLIADKGTLSEKVKSELKRLGAKNIHILGGERAVSPAIEKELKALKFNVNRIGGEDRYATAAHVAKEVNGKTAKKIFLASGEDTRLADALSIAPVSAKNGIPVLLIKNSTTVPKATMDQIKAFGVEEIEIIGGEMAVNSSVKKHFPGVKFERTAGDNRWDTSLAVARKYFKDADKAIVTYGWKYADALVGGYFGAMNNAPVLLTGIDKISPEVTSYLESDIEFAYILGGTKAVSQEVIYKIVGVLRGKSEDMTITILGTTDIHGNIYNWSYEDRAETNNSGMAKVKSVVDEVRAENPNTILVDAGDLIQGTILTDEIYTKDLTRINPMIDVLNFMEYDAMALGNHEFNFGVDVVEKAMIDAKFPVLSANILNKADNTNFARPYTIIEKEGVKVGILGLTTPNIPRWDGDKVKDLDFIGMDEAADKYIDEMKEKGADVIVTVSHSSLDKEYQEGDYMRSVIEKHPDITASMVGHSHKSVNEVVGTTVVGAARDRGSEVVRIDIDVKKSKDKIEVKDKKVTLIKTDEYEASADLKEYTKEYHQTTLDFISNELGTASADFQPKNEIKGIPEGQIRDTAVIDLINKIQLDNTDADVSAAALFSSTSNIKAGPVTYADIFGIYKYPNTLYTVEVTGQELMNYMEWSYKYYNQFKDGDINVSFNPNMRAYLFDMFSGVDYKVDISKPAGERVTDIKFKGQDLKTDDKLKLVINDYRYSVLKNEEIIKGEPISKTDPLSVREMISSHIQELGTIDPIVDNNWEIIGADFNHALRDYIITEVNEGRIELPKSEDGRTPNVKSLNVYELIKDGKIPASVLEEHNLDANGKPK